MERSSSFGAGSFGMRRSRTDGELFPLAHGVGHDGSEEIVGAGEGFGLAFEIDLPVFVEVLLICDDAGVEDGVEFVAVAAGKEEFDQSVDLLR